VGAECDDTIGLLKPIGCLTGGSSSSSSEDLWSLSGISSSSEAVASSSSSGDSGGGGGEGDGCFRLLVTAVDLGAALVLDADFRAVFRFGFSSSSDSTFGSGS
jgi:hypothetical protein